MESKQTNKFELIVAIIRKGFSDYVVSAAREAGATGATTIYGRGTSNSGDSVMGISLQTEKEIVTILVSSSDRRKIMQAIADKTSLMEEGRGICFSLPVSKVYGRKMNVDKLREQKQKAKEEKKKNEEAKV